MKKSYVIQDMVPSFNDAFLPISDNGLSRPSTETIFSTFESSWFYDQLISLIQQAQHTILLSSFLIADQNLENTLTDVSKRGVRVYILTSTDVHLKKMEKNKLSDFDKETIAHHVELLDQLAKYTLCRSAEHLHAKFILIDPIVDARFNSECRAFISTANFTTKALQESPELIVEVLREQDKKELYKLFVKGFWVEARQELKRNGTWVGVIPKALYADISLPHTSKNNNSLSDEILSRISNAQEITLSAFSFQKDHVTIQQLLGSEKKMVKIFTRQRQLNADAIKELMKMKNTTIYLHENIHAKFILTVENGQKRGLVFTSNLSGLGLDEGFEVGIDLTGDQIEELEKIIANWEGRMQYRYSGNVFTKDLEGITKIMRLEQGFTEFSIQPSKLETKKTQVRTIRELKKVFGWLSNPPYFVQNKTIFLKIEKELDVTLLLLPKKLEKQLENGMPKRSEIINKKKIDVFSPKNESDFIIVDNIEFLKDAPEKFNNLKLFRRN